MKKIWILFFCLSSSLMTIAQDDAKSILLKMNQCITAYSADQAQPLSLFSISGMLEQKQSNLIQRISISGIQKIQVEASKLGYSVNITCGGGNPCINLVKSDMSTSNMESTSFFFNNLAAANSFAENCQKLIAKLKKMDKVGELILYKDTTGQTPLLSDQNRTSQSAEPQHPIDPQAHSQPNQITSKPKEKTIKELQEEESDEPIVSNKNTKNNKASKTKKTKDDGEDMEEQEDTKVRYKKGKEDQEPEIDENISSKPNTKKQKNKDEPLDDVDDEQTHSKDLCDQLMNIVKSGITTQFKDIEGKETNTEKKIKESKIKLKGARKSYLSWFNQKRAFIAELKLVDDNDFAVEEFQSIQNQLDECLAGWDDEDHSTDDIYESIKYEVKDVEYTDSKNPNSPSIRLIIASEGKKFIVFLRVQ